MTPMAVEKIITQPLALELVRRTLRGKPGLFLSTGQAGSGKSLLLWSLIAETFPANTPVTLLLPKGDVTTRAQILPGWRTVECADDEASWEKATDEALHVNGGLILFPDLSIENIGAALRATRSNRWVFSTLDTPFVGLDVLYDLYRKLWALVNPVECVNMVECISGFVSQTLAPRLCGKCATLQPASLDDTLLIYPDAQAPGSLWREKGCPECDGKGVKGRVAIQEVLLLEDRLKPGALEYLAHNNLSVKLDDCHVSTFENARFRAREGHLGIQTFRREILRNPLLRIQHLLEQERTRSGQIKRLFGRFVTHSVAERLLSNDVDKMIEGERREISCLFADVRGFTPLSERCSPRDLFSLLNEYFSQIVDIVFKHDGTIDKFIGDAIMVVFGAPLEQPNHALSAVRCAMEIQRVVTQINARHGEKTAQLGVGIGINSGPAIAGCLGNSQRSDYTVIGDTVNTAQRLESKAKPGEILIGPETYRSVSSAITCRIVSDLALKGKTASIDAYLVDHEIDATAASSPRSPP